MLMRFLASVLYFALFYLIANRRPPDQTIGAGKDQYGPYLLRWWIFGGKPNPAAPAERIPRRPFGRSFYLHCFLRSDDDRAKHDHPWDWGSLILKGEYISHERVENVGEVLRPLLAGDLRFGRAEDPHRIQLHSCAAFGLRNYVEFDWKRPNLVGDTINRGLYFTFYKPVWTFFITGKWRRDWGFHCKDGWKYWRHFESDNGCGE